MCWKTKALLQLVSRSCGFLLVFAQQLWGFVLRCGFSDLLSLSLTLTHHRSCDHRRRTHLHFTSFLCSAGTRSGPLPPHKLQPFSASPVLISTELIKHESSTPSDAFSPVIAGGRVQLGKAQFYSNPFAIFASALKHYFLNV